MVTESGLVKVLDFGLAKLVRPSAPGTTRGAHDERSGRDRGRACSSGTPAYMSPEQAEGRPADARSDVFSFGAVLYEMLTEKRPFQGATGDVAPLRDPEGHASAGAKPRPEVDARLERLVERCLEKDPGARYPSAQELLPELEACLGREPGSLRRPRRRPAGWPVSACSSPPSRPWRPGPGAAAPRSDGRAARRCPRSRGSSTPTRSRARSAWPRRRGPFSRATRSSRGCGWTSQGASTSVRSEPEGAEVSVKPYSEPDAQWQELGKTPIEKLELPRVFSRFRIEKPGYATVELAFVPAPSRAIPPSGSCPRTRPLRGWCSCPAAPSSTGAPPRWSCRSSGSTATR